MKKKFTSQKIITVVLIVLIIMAICFDMIKSKITVLRPIKSIITSLAMSEEQSKTVNNINKMEGDKMNFTTSKGFKGYTKNGITYIDGILIVNKTYSLPSTYGNGLTEETTLQAQKMFADAASVGINGLKIASGFRSYDTQKNLYASYVKRDGQIKADTYSARAGHSEHQSGLAFDVCIDGYPCINDGFNDTPPANWLAQNAYRFGFILRYPKNKSDKTGYKFESWHYRYVGVDLATKLYNNGDWITLEEYFGITSKYEN